MQRSGQPHSFATHWRSEARKRAALAASIEAAAGLDTVRISDAKALRQEAANLLQMAADSEQEGSGKTH